MDLNLGLWLALSCLLDREEGQQQSSAYLGSLGIESTYRNDPFCRRAAQGAKASRNHDMALTT